MDMTTSLHHLWRLVVLAALFGGVATSFARCAVAELVVRASVWVYESDPLRRADRRETWLRVIADMRPHERPVHAGSLLWMAVSRLPARLRDGWAIRRVQCEMAVTIIRAL